VTVHLIKLCVGVSEPDELAAWQKKRWNDQKKAGQKPESATSPAACPSEPTRSRDGGSIYWVNRRASYRVRQLIKKIEPFVRDGQPAHQAGP